MEQLKMELPARFAAVIFDLDGTLLDTIADIAASMNAVLAGLGLPLHDHEAYKRFVGDGVEELVVRALPTGWSGPAGIPGLADAYRSRYAERWAEHSRPYPGVPALLRRLQEMGVRLAVLSNKTDHFAREMVAALLPDWRFDRVAGARPDVPTKPDPAAALALAGELGAEPSRIVFLGDSDIDMRTAVAAGMFPVAALWGFRSREILRASGARMLVDRPEDLLQLWR
jgi:phosphoglycolate phosphatase